MLDAEWHRTLCRQGEKPEEAGIVLTSRRACRVRASPTWSARSPPSRREPATRTEAEALLLENNLIKLLSPRYNILFATTSPIPTSCLPGTSTPARLLSWQSGSQGRLFRVPYPSSWAIRDSIHLLQKILPAAHLRGFGVRQSLTPLSPLPDQALQSAMRRFMSRGLRGSVSTGVDVLARQTAQSHRAPDGGDGGGIGEACVRTGGGLHLRSDPVPAPGQERQDMFQQQGRGHRHHPLPSAKGASCVKLAMVGGGPGGARPQFPANAGDCPPAEAVAA